MKLTVALSLACALFAGQVSALSCMRPDVAQAYMHADAAEERFIAVLGSFDFVPPPAQTDTLAPQNQTIQARFSGQYLSRSGFVAGPDRDVSLVFVCLASWCGAIAPNSDPMLAFVEQTATGYELRVGPCLSNAFTHVSDHDVARVVACMKGAPCEPNFDLH